MDDMALAALARKDLKARAHPLHPVVLVGDKGLTDAVLREIEVGLKSHELIKVRVAGADRNQRAAMLEMMCARLGAQPVQHIGRILVLYRENPPAPPPARRQAPPQRTRARTIAKASRRARTARPPRPGEKSGVVPVRLRAGSARIPTAKRTRSNSGHALATTQARRPASAKRASATTQARRPVSAKRAPATTQARRPASAGRALAGAPARRAASSGRAPATTPARQPANSGRALATAQARRPARTR